MPYHPYSAGPLSPDAIARRAIADGAWAAQTIENQASALDSQDHELFLSCLAIELADAASLALSGCLPPQMHITPQYFGIAERYADCARSLGHEALCLSVARFADHPHFDDHRRLAMKQTIAASDLFTRQQQSTLSALFGSPSIRHTLHSRHIRMIASSEKELADIGASLSTSATPSSPAFRI